MLYCKLNNRSLISFVGKDVISFLQGIITNDINKAKNDRAIYASLLSPQGKILKDFFLFKVGLKIYLDTASESLKILEEKLNIYKINQEIKFSKENFYSYYIFYGKPNNVFNLLKKEGYFKKINKTIIFNDPRKLSLGCRIICLNKNDNNKIEEIIKDKKINKNDKEYNKLRIINCIPDIKKDNLYNNAYLLQNNFDKINAICWKKGCFVGQEVTSRMKHKAKIKKKIYTIKSSKGSFKEKGNIKINSEVIGTISSFHEEWAIGLMEIDKVKKLKKKGNYLVI